MIKLEIDENDITISKSSDGISLLIENFFDCLTLDMTEDEAKDLIYALQAIITLESKQ